MKGRERRKTILEQLEREGCVSINALATELHTSKMTIHRDLAQLEEQNLLRRIFGGAVPIAAKASQPKAAPATSPGQDGPSERRGDRHNCLICSRPAPQHLLYSLTLANGDQRFACCPHCGISAHLVLGDQVRMALTADYLSGKPHPAPKSYFLMGSVASPCCHPSILTFDSEEMAQRFQTGFGGAVGRLADAITFLETEMTMAEGESACPHCAQARVESRPEPS